ncbi:Translation initiation factor IF3-2, chloroplastic [Dionaea muscipula]
MAGLAGNRLFSPPISRLKPPPTPDPPFSLTTLPSNFLGLRMRNSAYILSKSNSIFYISTSPRTPLVGRYGDYTSDVDEASASEVDKALDLSSISSQNVRLIDENQNMVGIVSKSIAMQMAEDAKLDLVVLAPNADPPVVKIVDYDKYRYEEQKKNREQQKKNSASRTDIKVLKMGYNIDVHDYSVRFKAAQKFLNLGNKVKVIINLKGRENQYRNIAIELLKRFQRDLGELASEESQNFIDRNMYVVLKPKLKPNKAALQKAKEPPMEKENLPENNVSAGI